MPVTLYDFYAGDGINVTKVNYNFSQLQTLSNSNESQINTIAATALHKNGDNLEQSAIDTFKKDQVTVLSTSGSVTLDDNKDYFLTPTGNVTIVLPTIASDQFSHTITLIVAGSEYSVDLGTTYTMSSGTVDTEYTYSVLYIYNKLDNHWYYLIGR